MHKIRLIRQHVYVVVVRCGKEQKVDTWLSVDQLSFSIFKSLEDGRRVVSD